jgi:hypothetical protein
MSLKSNAIGPAGDIVQDPLNEDDADVDVTCHIGKEFIEQIVDWVERVAGRDAGNGGGKIRMDTGHIRKT